MKYPYTVNQVFLIGRHEEVKFRLIFTTLRTTKLWCSYRVSSRSKNDNILDRNSKFYAPTF